MSLLAPLGLLALLSLPLIVILHMLRERRRRVVVPSLLLWQLLPQRQEAQRRRRLPLSLLLLLHLLAAALLALALTRPELRWQLFGGPRHTVLILDTSTSMGASTAGMTRLDAAREGARNIIVAMGVQERVTLIATGMRPQLVETGGPDEVPQLLAALDGLRAAGTGSDLGAALTMAEAVVQGQAGARIVVVSDAALPEGQLKALAARPAALPIEWVSLGNALENRALVTLTARTRGANAPVQIYARAVNYGPAPFSTVLRLFGDEQLLDTRLVNLAPDGEAELTWSVPQGVSLLRAELDGQDGLPVDDVALLRLNQIRPLQVVLVTSRPEELERALRALPELSLHILEPMAYPGQTHRADLTIFDSYLPESWPAGGVLVINPPMGAGLLKVEALSDTSGLAAEPVRVDPAAQALFEGISLSNVEPGPIRAIEQPGWAKTLLWYGEQPLMLRGRNGTSEVAIWAFDLHEGNLTTRLAFPLLVARSVRDLTPPTLPGAVLIGEEVRISPDPRTTQIEVAAPDSSVQVLSVAPGERPVLQLETAGRYTLLERVGTQQLYSGSLPVNAGAQREADLRPQPLPERTTAPDSGSGLLTSNTQPIWPWLAALTLVVMLSEWIYLHARRRMPI